MSTPPPQGLYSSRNTPSYMVNWVSSFLSEGTCTLVFQGSPNRPAPVSVGTTQGSPRYPLLFLRYMVPFHMSIPNGVMLAYLDDFSLTVASNSHRGNIRHLQHLFSFLAGRGRDMGVSFSIPKTELIHWRTPSQKTPHVCAPIKLHRQLFHPSRARRLLGYWLSPSLNSSHHFSNHLSLAQASFSFVKPLSSPGARARPCLCH